MASKQKSANTTQSKKEDKDEKKAGKQKMFCKYCKASDHIIKNCQKLAAKEAKKKEAGMAIQDTTPSTPESANVVQDSDWAFTVQCSYDPSCEDLCMVVADVDVWYFDSGATKHIASQHSFFTSLCSAPIGNSVSCANDSSYPVQGVGQIVLIAEMAALLHYQMYYMSEGSKRTCCQFLHLPRLAWL